MDDSNKAQFGLLIGALLEPYGQEVTEPRLYGYWIALRDISLGDVENAVVEALKNSKDRTPNPAELRELATGGSPDGRAVMAWGDVQKSATVSYMADLDFEDRTINAVIRLLGGRTRFLQRLCESADTEKWLRIDFLKTYSLVSRSGFSDEASDMLPGSADRGEVRGRQSHVRMIVIKCDEERMALLPPRNQNRNIDTRQSQRFLR